MPAPGQAWTTIGAAGGTLDGPDGVQPVCPKAALALDTSLCTACSTIGVPMAPEGNSTSAPAPAPAPAYGFTPHRLEFGLPVTIRTPFSPPASAPATDTVLANPGESWRAMQVTVTNGAAEFKRLSLSHYVGWGCIVAGGNTDSCVCVWPQLGIRLAATPASAPVIKEAQSTVARSTVGGASALWVTRNQSAAADGTSCRADLRVRTRRKN